MQINSVSQLTEHALSNITEGSWWIEVSNGTTSYRVDFLSLLTLLRNTISLQNQYVPLTGNCVITGPLSCANTISADALTTTALTCSSNTAELTARCALWS